MNSTHPTVPAAKWFTGKALQTFLAFVAPTLEQAMTDGYWQPGTSRKVRAALNKQAVAARFAKAQERHSNYRGTRTGLLDDVMDNRDLSWESTVKGEDFVHAMMFGSVCRAPGLLELVAALESHCVNDAERAALATARQWAADFAPIAKLMDRLDATRPKPVYVMGSISPTVLANVGKAMAIDLTSIAVPPMEFKWVEVEYKGQMIRMPQVTILWPEGTRHRVSRFAFGSRVGNEQCHACGHAIQNNHNWCPLVATTEAGPISLWVGKDCARKLFAVDVKGEVMYATSQLDAA